MDIIFQIDSSILLWIQENIRSPYLTPVVKAITHLGDVGMIWILLALVLLCFRRTRIAGAAVAAALLLALIFNNILIKNLVDRIRPYELIDGLEVLVPKPSDASFPSGHSCASFASAMALWGYVPRKYGIAAVILASMIALSRIYVGVHYPTDILAGALLGCLLGWAARKGVRPLSGNALFMGNRK